MKQAGYEQVELTTKMATGQINRHRPGIEIHVEWRAGWADQVREELSGIFLEVMAQINDAEKEENNE